MVMAGEKVTVWRLLNPATRSGLAGAVLSHSLHSKALPFSLHGINKSPYCMMEASDQRNGPRESRSRLLPNP